MPLRGLFVGVSDLQNRGLAEVRPDHLQTDGQPLRESPGDGDAGEARGTPVIDPDLAPCVVCDGLQCMQVCESGALTRLIAPQQIKMGLAEVYESLCVRTAGETCTICVDRCPMGEAALHLDGNGPPIVEAGGCVGCGVCQNVCPTTPKAIVVKPSDR